jgi:hypothetical protein
MQTSQLNIVPLTRASLCLDCEMITAAHSACRFCGSSALLSIARALSRPGHGGALSSEGPIARPASRQSSFRKGLLAHANPASAESFSAGCAQGD